MTEIEAQWIQEMFRPDAVISAGISLVIIGGILSGIGKLAAPGAEDARKDLVNEARRDRDNTRLHKLQQEIKSVKRMPRVGKAMILAGMIGIVLAVVMMIRQ